MDPISITGIAALDAALTGAGVGAVGGLVTGKSPLKGALLGGALGGGGSLLGLGGAPIAGSAGGTMDAQMVQDAANAYIKAGYTPEQALGFIDQATKNVGGTAMNTLYGDAGGPAYVGVAQLVGLVQLGRNPRNIASAKLGHAKWLQVVFRKHGVEVHRNFAMQHADNCVGSGVVMHG